MICDTFEIVHNLNIDELRVHLCTIIGHPIDRTFSQLPPLFVDHIFEIDRNFHISR